MTPEERSKALIDWCGSPEGLASISTSKADEGRYVFLSAIAAAIRAAEQAMKERCLAAVEALTPGEEWIWDDEIGSHSVKEDADRFHERIIAALKALEG